MKKSLEAANLSEEEKVKALHDILPTLVAEQKAEEQPVNCLGQSLKRTEAIINKPAEVKIHPPFIDVVR